MAITIKPTTPRTDTQGSTGDTGRKPEIQGQSHTLPISEEEIAKRDAAQAAKQPVITTPTNPNPVTTPTTPPNGQTIVLAPQGITRNTPEVVQKTLTSAQLVDYWVKGQLQLSQVVQLLGEQQKGTQVTILQQTRPRIIHDTKPTIDILNKSTGQMVTYANPDYNPKSKTPEIQSTSIQDLNEGINAARNITEGRRPSAQTSLQRSYEITEKYREDTKEVWGWHEDAYYSRLGGGFEAYSASREVDSGDINRWAYSFKRVSDIDLERTGLTAKQLQQGAKQVLRGEITLEQFKSRFNPTQKAQTLAELGSQLPTELTRNYAWYYNTMNKSMAEEHTQTPAAPRPYNQSVEYKPSEAYLKEYEKLYKQGFIINDKPSAEYLAKYYNETPGPSIWTDSRDTKNLDYYGLVNRYAEEKNIPEWKNTVVSNTILPPNAKSLTSPGTDTMPYEYQQKNAIRQYEQGLITKQQLNILFPEITVTETITETRQTLPTPEIQKSGVGLSSMFPSIELPTFQEGYAANKPSFIPDKVTTTPISSEEYGKALIALDQHGFEVSPEEWSKATFPKPTGSPNIPLTGFNPSKELITAGNLNTQIRDTSYTSWVNKNLEPSKLEVFGHKIDPIRTYIDVATPITIGATITAALPAATPAAVIAGGIGFGAATVAAPPIGNLAYSIAPEGKIPTINLNPSNLRITQGQPIETKEVSRRAAEIATYIGVGGIVGKAAMTKLPAVETNLARTGEKIGLTRYEPKTNIKTDLEIRGLVDKPTGEIIGEASINSEIKTNAGLLGSRTTIVKTETPLNVKITPNKDVLPETTLKVETNLPTMDYEVIRPVGQEIKEFPKSFDVVSTGELKVQNVNAKGVFTPRTSTLNVDEISGFKVKTADLKAEITPLGKPMEKISNEFYTTIETTNTYGQIASPPTISNRVTDNLKKIFMPIFKAEGRSSVLDTPVVTKPVQEFITGKAGTNLIRQSNIELGVKVPKDFAIVNTGNIIKEVSPYYTAEGIETRAYSMIDKVSGKSIGIARNKELVYGTETDFKGALVQTEFKEGLTGNRPIKIPPTDTIIKYEGKGGLSQLTQQELRQYGAGIERIGGKTIGAIAKQQEETIIKEASKTGFKGGMSAGLLGSSVQVKAPIVSQTSISSRVIPTQTQREYSRLIGTPRLTTENKEVSRLISSPKLSVQPTTLQITQPTLTTRTESELNQDLILTTQPTTINNKPETRITPINILTPITSTRTTPITLTTPQTSTRTISNQISPQITNEKQITLTRTITDTTITAPNIAPPKLAVGGIIPPIIFPSSGSHSGGAGPRPYKKFLKYHPIATSQQMFNLNFKNVKRMSLLPTRKARKR